MRIPILPLLVLPLWSSCSSENDGALDPTLIHTVQRGDLVITVRERGELQAARDTRVSSELEGRATLIYLIDEGSIVETGTKLAELDVSAIEEKRAMQAIQVARAEAALMQARKNVEVMEKELLAAERTAESRLQIAKLRLQKFLGQQSAAANADGSNDVATNADMVARLRDLLAETASSPAPDSATKTTASSETGRSVAANAASGEAAVDAFAGRREELLGHVLETLGTESTLQLEMGELANQVLQQMDEVNLARADLELAKDTLRYSRELADEDFITANELARDTISYKRQLSRQTVAWNNLSLLVKYTLPETRITLEQEVDNSQLGLESVRALGEARRVREEAELQSNEAEYRLAREQLDNLVEQTSKSTLRAPNPGLVVYGRWDWDEPVFEGMEVRERQEIVILPDIQVMVAQLRIHESQIGKLALGQPATLRIDAFPSQTFTGRVAKVATLPEPTRRSSDPKVFRVDVRLDVDNGDGTLRPSMNSTVVVDVGTLERVLTVPLPALDRRGDDQFVWKVTAAGPVATKVALGGNNLTHVEIVAGLQENDRVYLVRPPGAQLPAAGPEDERVTPGAGVENRTTGRVATDGPDTSSAGGTDAPAELDDPSGAANAPGGDEQR